MILKIISLLLYPIMPFGAFLLSMKYFSKFYGYCIFILFGIYLNMCVIFRPQDDIYRYVEGYNRLLSGTDWLGKIDLYYWGSAMLFSYFNLSAIYVYIFWSIIYYTAMYLCLRELIKYINNNIISILFLLSSVFFISAFHFSVLRFFTASFWFIFFVKKIACSRKVNCYMCLLLICPLIHYMYYVPVIAYYIYHFFRPKIKLLLTLFIITYFFSFFDYIDVLKYCGVNVFSSSSYLSEARNESMNSSYNLGKYLYLPMYLSLLWLLYIQYRRRKKLSSINYNLLCLALWGLIVLNLVSASWDFTVRFRLIAEWLCIYPIAYYYQCTRDVHYNNFIFLFPFCFLLSNWDFLFVTGPKYFNYSDVFFSNIYSVWNYCSNALNNI